MSDRPPPSWGEMPAAPPTTWGAPPSGPAPAPPAWGVPPGGSWAPPPPPPSAPWTTPGGGWRPPVPSSPPPSPGRGRGALAILAVVVILAVVAVCVVVVDPMGVNTDESTAAGWRDDAADQDLSASTVVPARPSTTTTTTTQPTTTTTAPPTRLLPTPAPPPAPGPAAYLGTERDGDPIAWDPCETIQYVVNPRRAPAGAAEIVAEAMGQVSVATGLVFEDRGRTDETPAEDRAMSDPARYGEGWSPVLISWTDPQEWPALREEDATGFGWARWVDTGGGEYEIVAGEIQLDGEWATEAVEIGWRSDVVHLVMHELGHLVGLGHVDDRGEVMYGGDDSDWPTQWGPGDLTGLAAVGSGDCDPDT